MLNYALAYAAMAIAACFFSALYDEPGHIFDLAAAVLGVAGLCAGAVFLDRLLRQRVHPLLPAWPDDID